MYEGRALVAVSRGSSVRGSMPWAAAAVCGVIGWVGGIAGTGGGAGA